MDRGSTRRNSIALYTAALSAFVLPWLLPRGWGALPAAEALCWIGAVMGPAGLGLRAWAVLTLRENYTRTLRIEPGQQVVERGPYRWVRHPGYAGSLLAWTGVVLTAANWICLAAGLPALYLAYAHRMRSEEAMLGEAFGQGYLQYRARVRRLIPFLY